MKSPLRFSHSLAATRTPHRAFTLVELLVVIAIISILLVMIVPAGGRIDAITIRGAQELVEAELTLARQTAISRNLPVEVRVYRTDDGTGDGWRMYASVIPASVTGKTVDEWITPGQVLPGHVVINVTQDYSTLLSKAQAASGSWVAPVSGTESMTAPGTVKGKPYVAFRYRPDGSTNLPVQVSGAVQPWCVSLMNPHGRASTGVPATNYSTLVIDPLTGRTLSYQP